MYARKRHSANNTNKFDSGQEEDRTNYSEGRNQYELRNILFYWWYVNVPKKMNHI